jgi:hypothetical protein
MPIEIRELHIKAVVGADPEQQRGEQGGAATTEEDRELLVALCVERVMEVIARQKER